jgi:tetratricopeptide (TPR) repeat protein
VIRFLPIFWIAFKVWLMFDVSKRRAPSHWYYVIFFIPFGGVVYFFTYKIYDYSLGSLTKILSGRPSLDKLRYRADTSPSFENNIALGQALYDNGHYREAIVQFKKVLIQFPESSEVLHGIAVCHIALGAYDEAIPLLIKLIGIDPAYLDYKAWTTLAQAYWDSGQKTASLDWLRRLVKLNPRPDHQLLLVRCLVQLNYRAEALSLIDTVLRDYEHSPGYVQKSYRNVASEMRRLRKQL